MCYVQCYISVRYSYCRCSGIQQHLTRATIFIFCSVSLMELLNRETTAVSTITVTNINHQPSCIPVVLHNIVLRSSAHSGSSTPCRCSSCSQSMHTFSRTSVLNSKELVNHCEEESRKKLGARSRYTPGPLS